MAACSWAMWNGENRYFPRFVCGAAPLIVGGGLVAFIAIVPMQLQPMWAVLSNGQFGLFWIGITLLPTIKDFPLWFY